MPETTRSKTFVDTNILFYAVDLAAGEKHTRAKSQIADLWESQTGVLSTQVISEFTVNLRKKKALDWGAIQKIIKPYLAWPIVTLNARDTIEAMQIAERYQLSYWDALIVVSAVNADANSLFTEDLNEGQVIEGVRIVNPLR